MSIVNEAPEGKFLFAKFEFGWSFGMSLKRDGQKVEVNSNLELLVTLLLAWREFFKSFLQISQQGQSKFLGDKKFFERAPSQLGMKKL